MTSFNKKCVFYWLLCMAAVMLDQLNNDSRFSYVLLNCSCISVSHLNDWKCCLNLWIFRLLHVIYTTRCNIHVLQMPKAFGRHLRCKMHLLKSFALLLWVMLCYTSRDVYIVLSGIQNAYHTAALCTHSCSFNSHDLKI